MINHAWIGGVECRISRVRIEDLESWRAERGLVPVRRVVIKNRGEVLEGVLYWPVKESADA